MTAQPPFVLQGYTPPAPPPDPVVNINEVMDRYRKLRDVRDEMKQEFAALLAPVTKEMDEIEVELLKVMTLTGLSQFSSGDATAFRQTRDSYRIADPHAFRAWVEANNCPEFYENRVSKDVLQNYIANGGTLPPGVEANSEVVVNIRKK